MAIVDIAAIKSWFVTLSKPQQQHFFDWIDSFRHKNDKLTINDFDVEFQNLFNSLPSTEVIQNFMPILLAPGTNKWEVPAGTFIRSILVIEDSADFNFTVGTSGGDNDIVEGDDDDLNVQNGHGVIVLNKYFPDNIVIHFNNTYGTTIIKIFKN